MSSKREHYIGVRLTKSEREILNQFVSNRKISLADFFREAIFSHLKYLNDDDRSLNVRQLVSSINEIKSALHKINKNLRNIDEEIHIYGLKIVE